MLLGKMSQVKSGLVLSRRKAMSIDEVSEVKNILNIKNIEQNGTFGEEEYEVFEVKEKIESHYISQVGDVVMRLSYPYTALAIDERHEGLVVPSYFVIIRLQESEMLPEYLAWYLNREEIKQEIRSKQLGKQLSNINKRVIESLDIQILSMEKQRKMVELYRYWLEEQRILCQLMEQKKEYYEKVVEEVLRREVK